MADLDLTDKLEDLIDGPAEASDQMGRVRAQDPDKFVRAANRLRSQRAVQNGNVGWRLFAIKPSGAAT
jgi:hypothetical protein